MLPNQGGICNLNVSLILGHLAQGEQGNICQQKDDALSGFGRLETLN